MRRDGLSRLKSMAINLNVKACDDASKYCALALGTGTH